MVAIVFGDLAEKFIQGLRHLDYRSPIFLALIFLFKDKSSEVGTQQVYGRFIELFSEEFGVEIGWVFDMLITSVDLLSRDHLRDFENYPVTLF